MPRNPALPEYAVEHREKVPDADSPFPCCIARKVSSKEYTNTPAALAAMDKEWENLRTAPRPDPKDKGRGVWNESKVMEAADARAAARRNGKKAHFGRIAALCYEKK